MMEAERRLLAALAWMCEQYLSKDGVLDHSSMSAGGAAPISTGHAAQP